MKGKLLLEFVFDVPDEFHNTQANRNKIYEEIKNDLPAEMEITRLLLFTENYQQKNEKEIHV